MTEKKIIINRIEYNINCNVISDTVVGIPIHSENWRLQYNYLSVQFLGYKME